MIKRLLNGLLDFIIPPVCVSCGNFNEHKERFICGKCRKKLERYDNIHPWRDIFISKGYIDNSLSLYRFIKDTPIQYLVHSLKYEKMKTIGVMLGKEIAAVIPPGIKFDFLVPVPLHHSKERERTYNQSEFICKGISAITGAPVLPALLKRSRFTESQTKKDRLQRTENVKGAFEINVKQKALITGKNIILADDVITTGSTILECARTLKENNAGYVLVCSAAYDALD